MVIVAIFLLLFLCVFVLIAKKDFYHPSILITAGFLFSFIIYYFSYDLFTTTLSDESILLILSFVALFVFSSFFGDAIISKNNNVESKFINKKYLKKNIWFYSLISILASFLYTVVRLDDYRVGTNLIAYISTLRDSDVESGTGLVSYLQPFFMVGWCYFIISVKLYRAQFSKRFLLLTTLTFLMVAFAVVMNTGKQAVYILMISSVISLNVQNLRKIIVIGSMGLGVFIIFMFVIRGLNNQSGIVIYYLAKYSSSALVAYQDYFIDKNGSEIGSNAFWFFNKIASVFNSDMANASMHLPFVDVGMKTNVYTAFSAYTYYSIFCCYFFMIVQGVFSGYLWREAKHSFAFRVFYAIFAQCIFFMFFHETFFINISLWIQIAILTFLFSLVNVRSIKGIKSEVISY